MSAIIQRDRLACINSCWNIFVVWDDSPRIKKSHLYSDITIEIFKVRIISSERGQILYPQNLQKSDRKKFTKTIILINEH